MTEVSRISLSRVFRATIPGIWNQIQFESFPTNWAVLGFSTEIGAENELELEAYGSGGLTKATSKLRHDVVQFIALRFSVCGKTLKLGYGFINPIFVLIQWQGKHASEHQLSVAKNGMSLVNAYFDGAHVCMILDDETTNSHSLDNKQPQLDTMYLSLAQHLNVSTNVQLHVARWMAANDLAPGSHTVLPDNEFCTQTCYHYENLGEDEVVPPIPGLHKTRKNTNVATNLKENANIPNSEELGATKAIKLCTDQSTTSHLVKVRQNKNTLNASEENDVSEEKGSEPSKFGLGAVEWQMFQTEYAKLVDRNQREKQRLRNKIVSKISNIR